jgi:hypothetical protein
VLPAIALLAIGIAIGCANAPTEVVRSSTPVHAAALPPLRPPATRTFKETLLFVQHATDVRAIVESFGSRVDASIDPRERPAAYVLSGAHGDATIDLRFPSSPIALSLTPSTSTLLLGGAASLDVSVTDDGAPIDDATIDLALVSPKDHARRSLPSTTSHTIDLATLFHHDDPIGVWTIEVRAKGVAHGVAFDRFGTTAIHFAVPTATLASVATPRTLDDGSIEVDTALDVATHDRLEITAYLVSNDDRPVARANTTATFEPGTQKATLHFDRDAFSSQGNGPFTVRRVRVFSITSSTTLAIVP